MVHRSSVVVMLAASGSVLAGTSMLSLAPDGTPANGQTRFPVFSGDMAWVFFSSDATNLVDDDNNGTTDIFARHLLSDEVTRISVSSTGAEATGASGHVIHTRGHAASHDGRFVAFYSQAGDLVPDDSNGLSDLFLRDRDPDENGVFDEAGATTIRITRGFDGSEPNGLSGPHGIDMSADGRWLVFFSEAENLVAEDDNLYADIFLYDRISDTVRRISIGPGGEQGDRAALHPAITRDGRYISYYHLSDELNAADGNLEGDTYLIDRDPDENGILDESPWVHELISVSDAGDQGNEQSRYAWTSDDGRLVAFESLAGNLVADDTNLDRDMFLRDRDTGLTTRLSVDSAGNEAVRGGRYPYVLSRDGTLLAFRSPSNDLVPDDTNNRQDIFLHDIAAQTTERVSLGATGDEVNGNCQWVWMSDDNRWIAFETDATNVVPGGTPAGVWHSYVFDRGGPCPSDVNHDGVTDFEDLNLVLSRWGRPGPGADADGSGTVDFNDLNAVLAEWATSCN